MATAARYFGLVPAGGAGRRFGADQPKQYSLLGGLTLLERSVQALLADSRLDKVYVVVAPADDKARHIFQDNPQVVCLPLAGAERANTVLNALSHLLENRLVNEVDWVLVHDAARPGLSADALGRLIGQASLHYLGGLLAMPVADTLKKTSMSGQGEVVALHTVPRQQLWAAQTPQMFRAQALARALTDCLNKGLNLTDDASAMEALGGQPLIIQGHLENMKITLPDDLKAVACLMKLDSEQAT